MKPLLNFSLSTEFSHKSKIIPRVDLQRLPQKRNIYVSRSINVHPDLNGFSVASPADPVCAHKHGSTTTRGMDNSNDSENSNKLVIDEKMVYNQTTLFIQTIHNTYTNIIF